MSKATFEVEATGDHSEARQFIHRMQFMIPKYVRYARDRTTKYRVRLVIEQIEDESAKQVSA